MPAGKAKAGAVQPPVVQLSHTTEAVQQEPARPTRLRSQLIDVVCRFVSRFRVQVKGFRRRQTMLHRLVGL